MYTYEQFYRLCYQSEHSYSHHAVYNMYLKTDRWASLREERLRLDDHKCRICGDLATQVHHPLNLYPKVLGTELVAHLSSMCERCHHNIHHPAGLDEHKKLFFDTLAEGKASNCVLCGKYAKYELRPINVTMGRSLIWIVSRFLESQDWVHVPSEAPQWLTRTNQHTTLAKWGLLERKANHEDKTKKHSGYWKPTVAGIAFAKNEIQVPYKVLLWDDEKIGETTELVSIQDVLASKGFDYSEIIASPDKEVAAVFEGRPLPKTVNWHLTAH